MISVAITTFCGSAYIEEQLESIRNQLLPVDEVIICDDCSKDNTVQIIEDYIRKYQLEKWQLIKNDHNLGYAKNFYKAIDMCRGDIIFLCDQDDVWYPQKTKIMTDVMNEHKEIMALSSSYDLCDAKGQIISNPGVPNVPDRDDGCLEEIHFEDFMGSSLIRGCAMCFRKEILSGERLFDLSALLGHDWLINIYACLKGKCCILYKKLSMYRVHQNNISFKAVGKTGLKSNKQRRIQGLKEEANALKYMMNGNILDVQKYETAMKQFRFVKRRLTVLEKRNIVVWLTLVVQLKAYKRIYGTLKGAVKVYAGDLLYSMKKSEE